MEKTCRVIFKKIDRTSYWVVHSKLKSLYINNFFEGKYIIDYLEAELTGALLKSSNTNNLAVDEEVNVDEIITAGFKANN